MTQPLPEPLVPVEVDLRDFPFMPLDVVRLRDSDLAALEPPEACWAAVLLWCASWHQVPAASVPDDDRVLANLAGFGRVVREWQKVRPGALRGWIACVDGRLYHPVVAEKALEAWRSKLEQRWRTECARIKKHNQRHELSLPIPEFEQWRAAGCPQGQALPVPRDTDQQSSGTQGARPSAVPRETRSKGQGEGQGQGIEEKGRRASRLPTDWSPGPEGEADAIRVGLSNGRLSAEIAKFRDYWAAQPGQKGVKADWPATWRNWCRRAAEDQRTRPQQRGGGDDLYAGAV